MIIPDDQVQSLILKTKLIDPKNLEEIVSLAKSSDTPLSDALVEKNVLSEENLGLLIADYLKIPFIVLSKVFIPDEVFHIVPERIARKYKIIAFERTPDSLKVAISDPKRIGILQMLAKKTGQNILPYLSTERDIQNTLRIYRKDLQKAFEELLHKESETPISKIVDMLINYAYQDRASDIHIEPQENNSLIRFRIDGILHDVLILPKNLHDQVLTRIKVLSRLRTDEHLSAQDGKMRIKLEEEHLDIRVSIIPIADGEKAVLRLLSSRTKNLSLLDLGMEGRDLEKITKMINKSYGMILSTGPTGSGKSTSIYAVLKILNTKEKNITTIEDPVEYRIKGVNQIHVNPKTNLTFASGLRSILRQDPNIIFVGEIRDSETAGIAVNAALTGHLVLSTLHTNDASTSLPRFIDMKMEPFLIASTVNIIIAQRLVRKICDMCKGSLIISSSDLAKNLPAETRGRHFGDKMEVTMYKGKGCKICHYTGYAGRIGIFEVLEVTKNIRSLITQKADADVIGQQAIKDGMTTMLDDGIRKVVKGLTTLEEVLRVTKVESL